MSTRTNERPATMHRIEIEGDLGRAAAEALQLEIRRLLQEHGLDATALRVERVEEDD